LDNAKVVRGYNNVMIMDLGLFAAEVLGFYQIVDLNPLAHTRCNDLQQQLDRAKLSARRMLGHVWFTP